MTVAKKVGAGVAVALVIVATIGSVAFWCTSRLIATSHWVAHAHLVLENLEASSRR